MLSFQQSPQLLSLSLSPSLSPAYHVRERPLHSSLLIKLANELLYVVTWVSKSFACISITQIYGPITSKELLVLCSTDGLCYCGCRCTGGCTVISRKRVTAVCRYFTLGYRSTVWWYSGRWWYSGSTTSHYWQQSLLLLLCTRIINRWGNFSQWQVVHVILFTRWYRWTLLLLCASANCIH